MDGDSGAGAALTSVALSEDASVAWIADEAGRLRALHLAARAATLASRTLPRADAPVNDLALARDDALLLVATDGGLVGYETRALLADTSATDPYPEPRLRRDNPQRALAHAALAPRPETNALALDSSGRAAYAAAGDGRAYAWDLEKEACIASFEGHAGMLHAIALREAHSELVTGSEDGTVRLWDLRSAKCTRVLTPLEPPLVAAAADVGALPKAADACGWCGCLAIDESEKWLVAGWGRSFLCTVELDSLACVAALPTAAPPQAVCFDPGSGTEVLSVGAERTLYHWTLAGELQTRALTSCDSNFALAARRKAGDSRERVVVTGGAGGVLDVFDHANHRILSMAGLEAPPSETF